MNEASISSLFKEMDKVADLGQVVGILDALERFPLVAEYRALGLRALDLRPHHHVLDIACGLGASTFQLWKTLGSDGRAVGIDLSRHAIGQARVRHGERENLRFLEGDAVALPFPAETFDRVRGERFLQHLAEPVLVLREVARVLRAGGRAVFLEPDWTSLTLPHPDQVLTAAILRAHVQSVQSPGIGADLPALAPQVALDVLSIQELVWQDATTAEEINAVLQMPFLVRSAVREGIPAKQAEAWARNVLGEVMPPRLRLMCVTLGKPFP